MVNSSGGVYGGGGLCYGCFEGVRSDGRWKIVSGVYRISPSGMYKLGQIWINIVMINGT